MTDNILLIAMAVIFTLLGLMMLLGKADFAFKRRLLQSDKYNIPRLRVIYAVAFLLISVISILTLCGVSEMVILWTILPVVVILIILQYTWARK